ncbi:MAG TPA: hypothetical protein VJ521_11085, partial [Acidobacteriota bacterium]|nr:hypothetical protein [Acidobacteriota bacterium]
RASGNPMLIHEYLAQTLKNHQCRWNEDEFTFMENDIPELPPLLLHLYRSNIPDLTAKELEFLEMASLQGDCFNPTLVETPERQDLLQSLTEKGLLHHGKSDVRFRKPLIAEAIYKGIETKKLKLLHLKLASEMLKQPVEAPSATVAKHFLKGGDYSRSLSFACKAIQELRSNTAESLLPLLQELHGYAMRLTSTEQLELYRQTARLFFRKGNHSAAIENCKQALALTQTSYDKRFELIVQMAESYLGINDIHSAQKLLLEHVQYVPLMRDEKLLLRYYLARALCGWHRGEKNEKDFAQAFQLAENQQDYEALAAGYRQRAELALREGDLQLAQSMSRKALRYARKTAHDEEAGHALRVLGAIAWRRSRYGIAERILKRAIQAFRKVENIDGIARVWSLLGNIYTERYLFAHATEAFQNALNLFSRLNHPLELSLAQFNLGLVYIEQCRLAEAERIFSRCLQLDRTAGNKRYYAFDLRALAVLSILRGYHRKADRLLKRAAEVFAQIQADGDILPTKFLQLFNELEQKNYRQAQPLIEFLRSQLDQVTEPMAQAEIHYLLAHYHGYVNETGKAMQHLRAALKLAGRIRYYKLAGKCLMLKIIFRNSIPARNNVELKRAIRLFERSHCELEFADYLLKLYQAYPALLKEKQHARRLAHMERLYRSIRHRPKHTIVRRLARGMSATSVPVEPLYGWWQGLIATMRRPENLSDRL